MVEVLIRRDQGTTPSKPNNTTEKVAPELLLGELIRYHPPRNVDKTLVHRARTFHDETNVRHGYEVRNRGTLPGALAGH